MPHSSTDDAAKAIPLEDGLAAAEPSEDEDSDLLTDKEWVAMFREALKASSDFQQTKLRQPWSRNYRAFANKHVSGSKYDTFRYRHRSKLFKPKTRMAVRKNDATAASAMFSTAEVVQITPERASDRMQLMTARFIHAALNYRLDAEDDKTGPNWFLTAIGARQDTQLTGICVSKQYWEYEEKDYEVVVDKPAVDINGMPMFDPVTGEDVMEQAIETEREVCRDRLMIDLLPPELAFMDPTADWRNPIQSGGYFIAGFPMRKDDLQSLIEKNAARPKMGGGAWRTDIDLDKITQARSGEMKRNEAVRRSRDDGIDRYDSRHADDNGDVIWLYECFYRYDGEDWHYWMLGEHIVLSDPRPTRDSYPEQEGRRPYVRGVGALETHKTHPTAPVESWQPLQQEMNDITNLTLDAQKMAISPITKIRRGRNIDFKQVQNRGPDAMVMVEEADDVTFEKAPTPDGGQQIQLNNLTVDFDELAGVFSTGSVQSNRQLNETVGGMNLMAGSANSLTEFDLRVWVETWVEPVLRQCVNLIRYFESDETIIAVAGENAGLIVLPEQPKPEPGPLEGDQGPKEQMEPPITVAAVLDNLDRATVKVKVNIGIGALDSRQKLEKFMGGVKMTMEMLPVLDASGIMPDAPEMMNEAWGLLGYKDAERFFKPKPQDNSPPPEVQQMMMEMKMAQDEHKAKMAEMAAELQMDREQHKLEMAALTAKLQGDREARADEMQFKRENRSFDMQTRVVDHQMQHAHAESDHEMNQRHADEQARQKAEAAKLMPKPQPGQKPKQEGSK